MKAQIFFLPSQMELCREIEILLEDNLYQRIKVERKVFDDDHSNPEASLEIGRSYFRLLSASMVRVNDFSLEVENSRGKWGYWGYTGEKGEYFVRLGDRLRTKVFPSVAVMDRMVMVPEGIHDAFDVPTGFSYLLRPLDLHGVLVVDFDDSKAIEDAVVKVAAQIRREIVNIGRRHMYVRKTRIPDLVDLSELLHVAWDFLRGFEKEIVRPAPEFLLKVTSGPVRLAEWSEVVLEVWNESEYKLGTMRAQIRAPRHVMRGPFTQYLDFPSGEAEHQTLRFEVRAQVLPYCPLEVLFLSDDAAQAFTFLSDSVDPRRDVTGPSSTCGPARPRAGWPASYGFLVAPHRAGSSGIELTAASASVARRYQGSGVVPR